MYQDFFLYLTYLDLKKFSKKFEFLLIWIKNSSFTGVQKIENIITDKLKYEKCFKWSSITVNVEKSWIFPKKVGHQPKKNVRHQPKNVGHKNIKQITRKDYFA